MSNAAAATVQTAAYGAERAKQETEATHNTTDTSASGAQDDFQSKVDAAAQEAHVKKETAVAEGKADVEQAKATTASYLDQARGLVDTALGTAQSYVTAGQERLGAATTHSTAHVKSTGSEGPKQGGLTDTLSGVALSALETTKGVLATAQEKLAATGQAAKPHAESAQAAAQPHVDAASAAVKPHAEAAQATIQPHVDAATAAAKPHVDTAKQALPDSIVDTSKPSFTTPAPSSAPPAPVTAEAASVTSPSTISYPAEPKTESHHVTTEASAAPERVDDKAVEKLADNLTTTKLTDAAPASTV